MNNMADLIRTLNQDIQQLSNERDSNDDDCAEDVILDAKISTLTYVVARAKVYNEKTKIFEAQTALEEMEDQIPDLY